MCHPDIVKMVAGPFYVPYVTHRYWHRFAANISLFHTKYNVYKYIVFEILYLLPDFVHALKKDLEVLNFSPSLKFD